MRKGLPVVLTALALLGSACVPPKLGNDREVIYDPITVMGRIQERGILKVAIPSDRPPFGPEQNPNVTTTTQDLNTFDVALAKEVAGALGVELDIRLAPNDELLDLVQPPQIPTGPDKEVPPGDPNKVDMAFPLVPITEAAIKQRIDPSDKESLIGWAYTNPYWIGHQRFLTQEEDIDEVADLGGQKVCQYVEPDTGVDITTLESDVEVIEPPEALGCAPFLRSRKDVTAGTGPDVLLAAWKTELDGWTITGEQLSTVGYGAVVQSGASSWRDYVNAQFAEFKAEGRWFEAYETYLEETFGPPPLETPSMTTEEAAALFPKAPDEEETAP
jgi:ABC-type amino acid transport substrate-binding protein